MRAAIGWTLILLSAACATTNTPQQSVSLTPDLQHAVEQWPAATWYDYNLVTRSEAEILADAIRPRPMDQPCWVYAIDAENYEYYAHRCGSTPIPMTVKATTRYYAYTDKRGVRRMFVIGEDQRVYALEIDRVDLKQK
jgi:hypothetical protein